MIDEEDSNFRECYEDISNALYACINEEDTAGLAGALKALIEIAEDLSFDKDDVTEIFNHYMDEIFN